MKVLLSALWPVGGIRTFFRYVYGSPHFADVDVTLVGPDVGLSHFLKYNAPETRITVQACEQSAGDLLKATRQALIAGEFDLLHSHGFSAGAVSEVARFGKRVPHLMTAHDVFLPTMFSGVKGAVKQAGLGYLFRRMDMIHAVTDDGAANVHEYVSGLVGDKVRPILHGVDADYFAAAARRNVEAEVALPSDSFVIGFFGRFMAQKGFRTLADAVRLLVDERRISRPIKVLTFGWGGFIREDYAYVESLGLADHFVQMPATNDPAGWMKAVDVVAMPSRWEACGLLGMEALCAGAPIVGTHCIGLREVLQGSPAPMVPPRDARALADALATMADPNAREAFQAYQATAVERFSVDRPARALRALYSELVEGRHE
ncbi:glycosyltransferase involved in cell wall biosynthesis [Natronocella acetinitrilica]|uniref:Glycosyltransferase involved in cell wall biosynthesis n=1 Tax=Natronocella acetinitrilica TaxID=414046 RepID=A0AAE3KCP0_9GAMM|nr:glycosyltransferase family 4 protein [Natronocella acetinitrilica]MCP1677150.1 glycosyltransferase involved in cell wall biosynthesis [Natronocella acetinitrilica]